MSSHNLFLLLLLWIVVEPCYAFSLQPLSIHKTWAAKPKLFRMWWATHSQLKMQLLRLAHFLTAHHFFRSLHWLFFICILKPSSSKLCLSFPHTFHSASVPLYAAPHPVKHTEEANLASHFPHKHWLLPQKSAYEVTLLKPNSSKGNLTLEHTGRKLKEWHCDTQITSLCITTTVILPSSSLLVKPFLKTDCPLQGAVSVS